MVVVFLLGFVQDSPRAFGFCRPVFLIPHLTPPATNFDQIRSAQHDQFFFYHNTL